MKTLIIIVAGALLATTALAQREVLRHERFLYTSSPIITSGLDSVFFFSITANSIIGRWYDVASSAMIGRWEQPILAEGAQTTSDKGAIFVYTKSKDLLTIDPFTGAIQNSIARAHQYCHVSGSDQFFVWQTNNTISRRSTKDSSWIEFIDTVKVQTQGYGSQYIMSYKGCLRVVDNSSAGRNYIVIDGQRVSFTNLSDVAMNSAIEGHIEGKTKLRIVDPITRDSLCSLDAQTGRRIQSAVLSSDGLWAIWQTTSLSYETPFLHATEIRTGRSLKPIELEIPPYEMQRVEGANNWMVLRFPNSARTYFQFDPENFFGDSLTVSDTDITPLQAQESGPVVCVNNGGNAVRIFTLQDETLISLGWQTGQGPFGSLAKDRYLVRYVSVSDYGTTRYDLYDVSQSPVQKTFETSQTNLDLEQLRRFETQDTWVRITDVLTDGLLIETNLPAPYKVGGDFEKVFEPHRMIADTQGVVFYMAKTYDRLWTQRPGESAFSMLWNGGQFRDLIFPGGSEYAYVVMYSHRVGRFSRVDGSFKGYIDERFPFPAISSLAIDPTTNHVIFSTPSALVFWDPIDEVVTDSIPLPNGLNGVYSWRVAHVSRDRSRIVIRENSNSQNFRGALLADGGFTELPTLNYKSRLMHDGLIVVTPINYRSVRVASIFGGEALDLGQGSSTGFDLFDNDSSIVFFGQDSTIIVRFPLGGVTSVRSSSNSASRFDVHQPPAQNILVNHAAPYTINVSDVDPGVVCEISVRGLDGGLVQRTSATPLSNQLRTSMSLEALAAGVYSVSVVQANRVLMRQCVMVNIRDLPGE